MLEDHQVLSVLISKLGTEWESKRHERSWPHGVIMMRALHYTEHRHKVSVASGKGKIYVLKISITH
jgi:hypothetical protein